MFDNPDVMNRKATIVKDLTNQMKYADKEVGIIKSINRKGIGVSSADQLGLALSIAEQVEFLKIGLKGHQRMQSVMDSSQPNATPSDLVASLRRTEDIVVVPLIPRVRRFTTKSRRERRSQAPKRLRLYLRRSDNYPQFCGNFLTKTLASAIERKFYLSMIC